MKEIPAVGRIVNRPRVADLIGKYGRSLVTYSLRQAVASARKKKGREKTGISEETIITEAERIISEIAEPSLKPVMNATGVALHTNLGRAPMGKTVLDEIAPIIEGYCNVEFDLAKARRGHRADHVAPILKFLTGAEDVAVVNNNAAAIILALHTLAAGREVVVSRGELIEIGGAFRIPEIMAAAGVKMVEVGTTNRTRIGDYAKAVTRETALLFKAHKSNYAMKGFVEEASIAELAALAKKKKINFLYDIGSGLLRKPGNLAIADEPDVRSALREGAGLVTFSCDKLMGGPQAGVIAGRGRLVAACSRAPLMRALRVGKLTLASLGAACRTYLDDEKLYTTNPLFSLFVRSSEERHMLAENLLDALRAKNIPCEIVDSDARCGGGTLPDLAVPSFAVKLVAREKSVRERAACAENIFHALLEGPNPILGILREGSFFLDVFALEKREVVPVAQRVAEAWATRRVEEETLMEPKKR